MTHTIEPASASAIDEIVNWQYGPPLELYDGDGIPPTRERFGTTRIILDVAALNERAIKVYERAGFREIGRHVRPFERWGNLEFVDMELAE